MKTLDDWLALAVLAWPLGLVLLVLLLSGCAPTPMETMGYADGDRYAGREHLRGVLYDPNGWLPPVEPPCHKDTRYCPVLETPEDAIRSGVYIGDALVALFGG